MENTHSAPVPRLTTPLPKPLKDRLKIVAVKRDQSLQELVRGILQDWIDAQENKKVA